MKKHVRIACLSFAIAALAICGGCRWPSERACYDVACQAALSDTNFPKNAVLYPIDKSKVFVCKSAACVEVFYDQTTAGRQETESYTVWCKRIARRWELDYFYKTPRYDR